MLLPGITLLTEWKTKMKTKTEQTSEMFSGMISAEGIFHQPWFILILKSTYTMLHKVMLYFTSSTTFDVTLYNTAASPSHTLVLNTTRFMIFI